MREWKRVLVEALLVTVTGVTIALVANAGNPQGLALGRDYFRFADATATQASHAGQATRPEGTTTRQADPVAEGIKQVLRNNALQPLEHDEAVRLFRDPWYLQGLYLFVDARDDDAYAAGHIPGAYHIYAFIKDESTKEQLIQGVLNAANGAEKIVVYCNGGHCDDSVQLACDLRDRGVDPAKLFVYIGGLEQWAKEGLPVERGARGSGNTTEGGK